MTEKETFNVGDRVEQLCITCGEERGHIVASLNKLGRISRVSCPACGSRIPYKARVGIARTGRVTKAGAAYDRTHAYRKGQTFMHPMFGTGEVTAVIEPGKMDVLFADRLRRLVHSQPLDAGMVGG
jgi:DNA-directed RNA polymerase subunit RPC12/RpoP